MADIRNNRVHDNNFGICVVGTDHRVRNNVTEANLLSGILIQQTTGGEVASNTTRNNGQAGISAFLCAGPPTIHHNLSSGNHLDGIFVQECAAVVRNNTVRGNGLPNRGISVLTSTGAVVTHNIVQSSDVGVLVLNATNGTVSFNSISFNKVGIDLKTSDGFTLTRNSVSRSTTVDCRWDGSGTQTFLNNSCRTEIPPGAWD